MAHCAICVGCCAHDTLPTFYRQDHGGALRNKRGVGPRRSLPPAQALSVSGPGALSLSVSVSPVLSVLARRSLWRAPALSCQGPAAVSVSGPGVSLSVSGPKCCLCRGRSLSRCSLCLCRAPARSASGPGRLCVATRRSPRSPPCQGPPCVPALSVSGPGALPVGICVGPRRSPGALCVGPDALSLSLSGLGASQCVGARRSLCQAPTLSLSMCQSAGLCVSALYSGPGPMLRSACQPCGARPQLRPAGPTLRSACHPSGPRAPNSDPRATHPARRNPLFQERTPNHTFWGKTYIHTCIQACTYTYTDAYTYTYTCTCTCRCTYTYAYTYTYMCVYMCIYIHIYIYISVCMYIHIYIHTCRRRRAEGPACISVIRDCISMIRS